MKKNYLLILGLTVSVVCFGQKKSVSKKPDYKGLCADVTTAKPKAPLSPKAAGDVFFHEEFNGSMGAWTTSGPDGAIWMFDTDGPSGQFSATDNSDMIASTTNANGFMNFDADAANPSTPYTDKQGSLVSPVIDLTGRPSVSIRFQHAYRTCCTAAFYPKLEVTTDGFNTFTTYDVREMGVGVNDFSETVLKEVNIDNFLATAADLTNFQFRFNFDGISNSSSHYFWQVDDVDLFEPYQYSLRAIVPVWGTTGFWEVRLPYGMVPVTQLAPIDYSLIVENKGSVTQTDIVMETTIPEASFSNSGTPGTVTSFSIDTIHASAPFMPDGTLTTYNPAFSISSSNADADPSDDMVDGMPVIVNDTVYARDMNLVDGGSYNQGQGFEVGNIFDMFASANTRSASVFVRSTSNTGANIYVRLYSIDVATGDFVFAAESDLHTVTDTDKGTLVTLMFQDVVTLMPDNSYLVVAGSFGDGGATDDLIVGTSGSSEPQTTYYFDMVDQTWYYTTSTPIVRMNLISEAGLAENEQFASLNIFPNPAKDKVSIDFNLKNEASVSIQLTDLTGKVISTKTLGNTPAGTHSAILETASVSNGVYVLNVIANGEVSAHKLVINK